MKYRDYVVKPSFIVDKKIHWKTTGNGEFIIGVKDEQEFFIKRNIHVRYPSKDLPKELYNHNLLIANKLATKQNELRKLMKPINWKEDHVLVEERNFWDSENMFTTVTHYIPNALPSSYDYSDLTFKEFVTLSLKIAKLIKKVNDCSVIHGDIKEKNLVICLRDKEYIPYLIDFDSSYSTKNIPSFDSIAGTDGYQSPEVIEYTITENEELKTNITKKVDVFSLGILFHRMWTNSFPIIDMERGSVGEALLLNKSISFSRRFDETIGPKNNATFISLINWMLEKDISLRASIDDVIMVLSDEQMVDERFLIGSDIRPFDTELWKVHSYFAQMLPKEKLKEMNITSLKRFNEGCGSSGLKYLVVINGVEKTLSITKLIEEGYVKLLPIIIDEPWKEHKIKFIDPLGMLKKGYYKITKVNQLGNHKYIIKDINGREIDRSVEWFVKNGIADLIKLSIKSDSPWPEHGTEYVLESLEKYGVKSISRVEIGTEHRYRIVYHEMVDGKNKVIDKVSIKNIRLMGYIK